MKGLDCKQPGGNPSGQTTANLSRQGTPSSVKHSDENIKDSAIVSERNYIVS